MYSLSSTLTIERSTYYVYVVALVKGCYGSSLVGYGRPTVYVFYTYVAPTILRLLALLVIVIDRVSTTVYSFTLNLLYKVGNIVSPIVFSV